METRRTVSSRRGLVTKVLHGLVMTPCALLLALLVSIAIEWVGMTWWWPEEGIQHSRHLLEAVLQYLATDARHVFVHDAARVARTLADSAYHTVFERTRFTVAVHWLYATPPTQDPLRLWLHRLYLPLHDYSVAALTVTQLFAVRLAVLLLALPAFAVFGLVGLCDGLVERDLRRWGGGRESSWRYHQAKRLVLPLLGVGGLVYLALPLDVTPGFVIVPFAMLFGLALAIMASTFKKYL